MLQRSFQSQGQEDELREGSRRRWGAGGRRVKSHGPRRVARTYQDFQLAPLQGLVQVARAREGEFLQELREASFDHGDQAKAPRSASRPPAAAPVRVPRSPAWPGLAARAQTSRAGAGLPGSRLPARRRCGPAPGAELRARLHLAHLAPPREPAADLARRRQLRLLPDLARPEESPGARDGLEVGVRTRAENADSRTSPYPAPPGSGAGRGAGL